MTHKKLFVTGLAIVLSATASFHPVEAAKQDTSPTQSVTVKSLGKISCVASSIEKNADGTLKSCILTENKTVPGADITCAANGPVTLHPNGNLQQCTLAFDRSYPDPFGVICDDGKPIELYPDGTLSKCTAANAGKVRVLGGGSCAINQPVEFYPDGQVKDCVSTVQKKVPAAATKEVYVTEFTCDANKE